MNECDDHWWTMTSERGVKQEISTIVGKENFLTEPEDLIAYSYDATGIEYLPWGVALPGSAGEVAELMRIADRERFPVIPRGLNH